MKSTPFRLASTVARLKSIAGASSETQATGNAPASRMEVLTAAELQQVAGGPVDGGPGDAPKGAWSVTATGSTGH